MGGPPPSKPTSTVWATVVDLADTNTDYQVKEYANPRVPIAKLKRIVKWLPRKDYMHPEEIEVVSGKPLSGDEWRALGQVQVRGDKVGGFPAWLTREGDIMREKLRCRVCDKNLRLLLQIDSNDNIPLQWGTDGCLAVFECQEHWDQVTGIMVLTT